MGQRKSRAGSSTSQGSACRLTIWSLKELVGTFSTYPGQGLRTTWELVGPNSRHDYFTENACRSPTLLIEANAVRRTVFNNQLDHLGMESLLSQKRSSSWKLVGCTIERARDVNGSKQPQMLLTPEEEMAGELPHAAGALTTLAVDECNGSSTFYTEQHVLATLQKQPFEALQHKMYCKQLVVVDVPMQKKDQTGFRQKTVPSMI